MKFGTVSVDSELKQDSFLTKHCQRISLCHDSQRQHRKLFWLAKLLEYGIQFWEEIKITLPKQQIRHLIGTHTSTHLSTLSQRERGTF